MKKNLFKIFIFILLVVFLYNTTFGGEEKIKTIKELKKEVKQIEQTKKIEDLRIKKLKQKLFINNFFKKNLLEKQKKELENIIKLYKQNKDKLTKELNKKNNKETIKKLLENEKEIYKKLIPYIDKNKYEEYKNYIKKDLELIHSKITLELNQTKKQQAINNKLNNIKKKIINHKLFINRRIEKIIRKKIDEKLQKLIEKPNFKKLSYDNKMLVFDRLEDKMQKRLNIILKTNNQNTTIIQIYKIIIDKIKEYKKILKK